MKPFVDRVDAGRQLASIFQKRGTQPNSHVLALPRGGVPVAAEISHALRLSLDVFVVRKLGAPDQPELAIGAIASGGTIVLNADVYELCSHQRAIIDLIAKNEREELQRRERTYRGQRSLPSVVGETIILVDDGAATGASMRAAIQALRILKAGEIVVALPVCSPEARQVLNKEADDVVCVLVPPTFSSVGEWYQHFDQTTDEEVCRLLQVQP